MKQKNCFPNATLTIVGPDKENLLPKLKNMAKELNLEIEFTGMLKKEAWIELSKTKNIFLNTTHFDNTPVSVIEAMALGLPIISTNVGGIPFLLTNDKNAILVNDDAVFEMVKAIKKLINDNNFRKNLINNARDVVETFDWNIVKDNWFSLLK